MLLFRFSKSFAKKGDCDHFGHLADFGHFWPKIEVFLKFSILGQKWQKSKNFILKYFSEFLSDFNAYRRDFLGFIWNLWICFKKIIFCRLWSKFDKNNFFENKLFFSKKYFFLVLTVDPRTFRIRSLSFRI